MKRVLHVLHSLERSGMEIMLLNSSAEWARHGYQCDVVATASNVGPVADAMRSCGYGVYHIPFRSGIRLLPRFTFIRDFYKLCGSGYDVVHVHTEAGPPVFVALAKLAGVRRVALTPHGNFLFDGVLRWRKRFERQLVRWLGGRYGMISKGVKECEWQRFRNHGVRIWNWLDTAHFRPPSAEERASARQSLGVQPNDFVIVSVGNCSRIKNHAALFRALQLLYSNLHPFYVHVGREEPHFPERSLAKQLAIEDRVRFAGSVGDVRPILWASDAFAMPSLNEGFSISAIEAVASRAPLVCSRVPGLKDLAEEARFTVLTDTEPESIAEGIRQLASLAPEERISRAQTDSEMIRTRFSVQNGVRSIVLGLYSDSESADFALSAEGQRT